MQVHYSETGEMLKKFNARDAKGLARVMKVGVKVVIMTSEDSPVVTVRAKMLKIKHCFIGVIDQTQLLKEICESTGIDLSCVAFIGDDVNDLECMQSVRFRACPVDALPAIKAVVHYLSPFPSGGGAVRDVCDKIVEAKQ